MLICICDDNQSDIKRLWNHLKHYQQETDIEFDIFTCNNAEEMLSASRLKSIHPDIVFMDIFMDGLNGLDAARVLNGSDYKGCIIFTTSSTSHAMDSFKIHANGYLVKPFTYPMFRETMEHCRSLWDRPSKLLRVTMNRKKVDINIDEIYFIETNGHGCSIHTYNGILSISGSLNKFTEQLKEHASFLRCHKSYLVNLDNVASTSGSEIHLKNDVTIFMSVRERARITNYITNYYLSRLNM